MFWHCASVHVDGTLAAAVRTYDSELSQVDFVCVWNFKVLLMADLISILKKKKKGTATIMCQITKPGAAAIGSLMNI